MLVKTSSLPGATGTVQNRDGIVHLIAEFFWDPQASLGARATSGDSRRVCWGGP